MTVSQFLKWREKLLNGDGDKYYPEELMESLDNCVKEVDKD